MTDAVKFSAVIESTSSDPRQSGQPHGQQTIVTPRDANHLSHQTLLGLAQPIEGVVLTDQLTRQVFEAVETLLAGFEAAAARDCSDDRLDWLSAALAAGHVHEGVFNTVLRLVFALYAEDRSLLPVAHPLYAEHLSVRALYER